MTILGFMAIAAFILYLSLGYAFMRFLMWFLQDYELIHDKYDCIFIQILSWFLVLMVWPSYVFDLGGKLVEKRNKNRKI
jgi:hypothetical protein